METKNRIPVMTLLLILINVVVYLYVEIHGSSYDAEYMIKMGAVYEPYVVQRHEYYRLITHFFLHFGFDHLFNNMISLLILGYSLEKVTGKIRFLIFSFALQAQYQPCLADSLKALQFLKLSVLSRR